MSHGYPRTGAVCVEYGHTGGEDSVCETIITFGHTPFVFLQDSDNPDLRDRGYIYWRLLSTDPTAAKEVVLADKPLISEETDRLEPNLLDGVL